MGLLDAEKASLADVQFYTAWHCPFAQRIWIALLEKGVTFEYKETNPYEKSRDFLSINPRGLVPVIVHKGNCIYESSICIEYIDEAFPGSKPLLPKDPYDRAYVRMWNDFITKKIIPVMYRLLKVPEKLEEIQDELLKNVAELSGAISDEGSYFMGEEIGMLDITLVPFTLRLNILKHLTGFEIPETQEYVKLRKWMGVCHAHESVTPTIADPDKLLQFHMKFMGTKASEETIDKKVNTF